MAYNLHIGCAWCWLLDMGIIMKNYVLVRVYEGNKEYALLKSDRVGLGRAS